MSDQHYTLAEIEALDLSIEEMALIRAVSPTVAVSSITGGHRVTFTDVVGDTTMDVMDGAQGEQGPEGPPGQDGQDGAPGADGQDGAPGVGVPSGGSTGQVLKKKSGTDYDTEWGNESGGSGVPSGGSTGQVLKKKSNTDYDTEWGSIPSAATSTPSDLGTAAVGSSSKYAKEDHVHKMPTASDVGAVASGQGVPSGGTSGQYLKKSSNSDYATEWGSISVPSASSTIPQPLGTAAAGSSGDYSRADHVHAKPTAADVGAIAAPVSPSKGNALSYNGSAWVAGEIVENVSGSTPSITAMAGVQYVCGEVSTLAIEIPASGCFDVVFDSGSTATVLSFTLPTAGHTLVWENDFDPTSLDANTTYEINIKTVGTKCLGVVGKWT